MGSITPIEARMKPKLGRTAEGKLSPRELEWINWLKRFRQNASELVCGNDNLRRVKDANHFSSDAEAVAAARTYFFLLKMREPKALAEEFGFPLVDAQAIAESAPSKVGMKHDEMMGALGYLLGKAGKKKTLKPLAKILLYHEMILSSLSDESLLKLDMLARGKFYGFMPEGKLDELHLRVRNAGAHSLIVAAPEVVEAFKFLEERNIDFAALGFASRFLQHWFLAKLMRHDPLGWTHGRAQELWVEGLGAGRYVRAPQHALRIIAYAELVNLFFDDLKGAAAGKPELVEGKFKTAYWPILHMEDGEPLLETMKNLMESLAKNPLAR